jgi:putative transposase
MTKTRRTFTDAFKREAVALLESRGRPLMQVAAARGIQPSLLRRWHSASAARRWACGRRLQGHLRGPGPCGIGSMPLASMGDAYDNAMGESFLATLACELLERRRFSSPAEARMAIFSFVEAWYDPHRLHSALGYQSPIAYEEEMQTADQGAKPHTVHQNGPTSRRHRAMALRVQGHAQEVVDKLAAALQGALKDPKVVERFADLGTEPVPQEQATPAALEQHLEAEITRRKPVIAKAGEYAD